MSLSIGRREHTSEENQRQIREKGTGSGGKKERLILYRKFVFTGKESKHNNLKLRDMAKENIVSHQMLWEGREQKCSIGKEKEYT